MNKTLMEKEFIIKNSLNLSEKLYLLSILENYGCKNIYLHHAIYSNSEKFTYILPDNFMKKEPMFVSAYNKSNGELHFFPINEEGISLFNYILFSTNNLNDIGKGIQYLGTDSISSKKLFHNNSNLLSKLIEMNEYYVYTLKKDIFLSQKDELEKRINQKENLNFCFAASRKDIIKLLNLQKGYLFEEMQYPSQILSEKFIFFNLLKILKNYRLFFLQKDLSAIAKCEWNAFSDKIFQIGGVYVEQVNRNKHYAYTLLYKMLLYSFINLEMKEASLFVRMTNNKAQSLYEKLLFKKYDINLIWAIFKVN